MKTKACLSDQDLTLHYYGELAEHASLQHLSNCAACRTRYEALQHDLEQLPSVNLSPDELAGTRMAARVTEQIRQPRKRLWLPAIGATAAAALVLVVTLTSSPPPEVKQLTQVKTQPAAAIDLGEDIPDIEFLEDLELLQELELIAKLEGV